MIELRKRRIEADMEGGETPSLPYTVIPERRNDRIGASMMGSTHTYDVKVILHVCVCLCLCVCVCVCVCLCERVRGIVIR